MNFKLTKWKLIVSIIIGLVVGLQFGWAYTWSGWIFHPVIYIIAFLVLTILSYIIWSLIQKRKGRK